MLGSLIGCVVLHIALSHFEFRKVEFHRCESLERTAMFIDLESCTAKALLKLRCSE